MPRDDITRQVLPVNSNGILTFEDAVVANGAEVLNDGHTFIIVDNTDAAAWDVTINSQPDAIGRSDPDTPVELAAGVKRIFGPWTPKGAWNQAGDAGSDRVLIDWEAATPTTVKVAALRI